MYQDPLIGEDVWNLKVGESTGDFSFSVKMVNLVQGFSKLKHDMSEDCFGTKSSCSSELSIIDLQVCYDCSLLSAIETNLWGCLENSLGAAFASGYFNRGTILYPDLKVECPPNQGASTGGCVDCSGSCSSCYNILTYTCYSCDLHN